MNFRDGNGIRRPAVAVKLSKINRVLKWMGFRMFVGTGQKNGEEVTTIGLAVYGFWG